MVTLVLTAIGDDRPGLVSALAAVISRHGGSWDRSQMARLGGKFAGIVLVAVPADSVAAVEAELRALGDDGLLDVRVTRSDRSAASDGLRWSLELVGTDRPGIVHEITMALAAHQVSIDELETSTREAPMSGGMLFEVRAELVAPAHVAVDELRSTLERLADELMVELTLSIPDAG
jgi:glycine cleavage system regulatory protein